MNPLWRRVLRSKGARPSAWNEPPPVRVFDCFVSLPLRTRAAPSERLRECWRAEREAKIASSSESSSSSFVTFEPFFPEVVEVFEVDGREEEVEEEVFVDESGFFDFVVAPPKRADAISMWSESESLSILAERRGGSSG